MRLLLLSVTLGLILLSCQKSVSVPSNDIQQVVQATFADNQLARFLNRPGPGIFTFRYEELPVHNNEHLPKPQFNIMLSNKHVIEYNIRMKDEVNAIPIIVEQVIIDHDSAKVNLRIPKQGVIGQFRLGKTADGAWLVTKAFVVET
ncbi:hypothetical protein HNQ93_003460 [Hymenobacter luteus]|uniref:Uncharacterized protein n=2 Tax=Hymenobacter TaxID=89966 RepID=A0A7W9T2X4_9BACT|nr:MULTISPECIES: hypothetical protein [Hymenobacter]MBB4602695.1 hypothetical protein [Hymenobacter latericoloratus]MBB6060586.1 hypothetical protein [Hymenobacter luteus]